MTDNITAVRRRLLRCGVARFLPDVLVALDTMVRWESLAAAEVRRLQLEKLNRLLEFHRARPFYHALCETVAAPNPPLRHLSELTLYPVVTKDFLRAHQQQIARTPQAYRELSTSGSSGTNLVFHQSREMVSQRTACVRRFSHWVGFDNWGDPVAIVWGQSPALSATNATLLRLKRWALNMTFLSAFGMNDELALRHVRRIRQLRPKAIDGYPSYLSRMARVALDAGAPAYTDAVVVHSGEQALPSDLAAITEFFGQRVFGRYGSREFGPIAHELPGAGGYRVAPTRFFVQNDADGGLLVTDLDNLATPFIRYDIGDAGTVVDEEIDGATTPQRIVNLEGRIHDRLETLDGRLVPGQFWTLLTKIAPGIEAFQVAQTAPDSIELRIQVDRNLFREEERARIVNEAAKLLGRRMTITVVHVPDVKRTAMGKRRFIVREF
jgi:phenylacetate-CoA ligase